VYAQPGYWLFVEQGTLLAQPVDAATLERTGEPIKIAEGISYNRTIGHAAFSISTTGVLAYQGAGDDSRLVWYDRRANVTDTGWGTQDYSSVRFSLDGQRAAVDVVDRQTGTADIWIYDVLRGMPVRFTDDPIDESDPVWSPDARQIMFRSNRGGPASLEIGSAAPNIFAKAVGIAGEEELLVANRGPLNPEDWSADGRWIAYVSNTPKTESDLWLIPPAGERKPRAIAASRFREWGARFAPNAARVAFVSNESGAPEVYVTSVPESGDKTRISIGGGGSPRWRGDGRELFYLSADNQSIMTVPIDWSPTFKAGNPSRLFSIGADVAARFNTRGAVYDVTPDGERFLISVPTGEPESSRITVVQNWVASLAP
jgi:dipeptidyl aminopeptidase/acylaminoacyl peptidase